MNLDHGATARRIALMRDPERGYGYAQWMAAVPQDHFAEAHPQLDLPTAAPFPGRGNRQTSAHGARSASPDRMVDAGPGDQPREAKAPLQPEQAPNRPFGRNWA